MKRAIAIILTVVLGTTMLASCGGKNKFKENIDDVVVTGTYAETDYTTNGAIKYVKPENENFVYKVIEYTEEFDDFNDWTAENFMDEFSAYIGISEVAQVSTFKSIDFKGKDAFYMQTMKSVNGLMSNLLCIKISKKQYYLICASTSPENVPIINQIFGSIEIV